MGKQRVRFGPQPYEAFISEVCEAFGCTPAEAEQQDPELVRRIFDVRNAEYGKKLMAEHSDEIGKHPGIGVLFKRMDAAMNGEEID